MTVDEDRQSDSSWTILDPSAIRPSYSQSDVEVRSDTSWDCISDRQISSLVLDEQSLESGKSHPCTPRSEVPNCSDNHSCSVCCESAGASFIECVVSGRWMCAISLLQRAADPQKLAVQRDGSGFSALSWAVYKCRSADIDCLRLICRLLILAPSDAKLRGMCRFLPLHDAAWGNAPSTIARVLCAVFPGALYDGGPGQKPHEVGQYHHTRRRTRFSWPEPETLLKDAVALGSEGQWLQDVVTMSLPPVAELRMMSVTKIESSLNVSRQVAQLLMDFIRVDHSLATIPEACEVEVYGRRQGPRRLRWPRGIVAEVPEGLFKCDEVDVFREPEAKDCRRWAGLRHARNRRCSFSEVMILADGSGGVHKLSFHAAYGVPKSCQKSVKQPKWPSKMGMCCNRTRERDDKSLNCGIFEG